MMRKQHIFKLEDGRVKIKGVYNEGVVKIQWDGFNVQGYSFKNSDGLDHIVFSIGGPIVKDEEYWRSEVD